MVATTGRPVRAAPATAASSSSTAEIVSIHSTSQPPSARASACSANAASPAGRSSAPIGAKISPVGPIEPATRTGRPAPSATARARLAAARFSAPTCACAPCRPSRKRLAPKLLVRMRSEPASTKLWCTARTRSGCSRFHSSGDAPVSRPSANRLVPMAPSATTTGWRASRSVSGSAIVPDDGFQSAPRPPRRRRGRLSATLVRPAARRRARRRCTIARRSASSAVGQSAISSSVRMQPVHRPEIGIQPAHADAGRGDLDHLRLLMAFDGGWSLAGSDRARAAGAQATRVAGAASGRYRRWAGLGLRSQGRIEAAQSRATSVRSSGSPSERRQPHLTMSPGRRLAYVLRSSRRSRRARSSLPAMPLSVARSAESKALRYSEMPFVRLPGARTFCRGRRFGLG